MSDSGPHRIRSSADRIAAANARFDAYKGPNALVEGIGQEVVLIMLDGRAPEALDADEFSMLLKGYNWTSAKETAFLLAKQAVRRWGDRFVPDLACELQRAYLWKDLELIARADELIAEGLGPAWKWRLFKLHRLLSEATEPSEEDWAPGDRIVNEEALDAAARELQLALETAPRSAWGSFAEISVWLAPIFHQPKFAGLRERMRIVCDASAND
ncbi:hypothetical protein J5226_15700 [Lysobacter sp. K5869]|uniref:hypothetical protein n=1 Tax=Lysobacter sp. K5869 TaxID=2820808 RepID=UPI001C0640EF|nr:hypothetical protein [Lysobacter sp. K5869]QWP75076.1 hypothetical protein J5226_15700 [Lysobacter sp. K5869]